MFLAIWGSKAHVKMHAKLHVKMEPFLLSFGARCLPFCDRRLDLINREKPVDTPAETIAF